MIGQLLWSLALAATPGATVSDLLRQLVGKWTIEEQVPGGQVNRGAESWSEAVPGLMFAEVFDLESNEGSYAGQAALWESGPGQWSGTWCSQDEGCFGLRATVEGGMLIVTGERKADGTHLKESFTVSGERMVQKLYRCAGQKCELISEIRGVRQR
jgi:hypothetical protein